MRKVKVKKVKFPSGADQQLSDMFNQLLNTGKINMTIAYPRYKRIKALCEQLVKLFGMLASSPFMRDCVEFAKEKQEIEQFCESCKEQITELFHVDFTDYEWNIELVEEEQRKVFAEVYNTAKKSNLVNTFIIMCNQLVVYKRYFADVNKLNHRFVTNMPGVEWKPFPFTGLNIKHVFSLMNIGENTIRFFMTVLNKSFELSYKLYEEVSSPDVDVDQLVNTIMASVSELQKVPELNRCKQAFRAIRESVDLLKNKFNGYYRDFITTKDNTIIMQHFISDVCKTTDASPRLTSEFRRIIAYYRKVAQQHITNPQIKMLFDKANDTFKELEKGASNLVQIKEEDSEEDFEPLLPSSAMSADDIMGKK